MGLQYYRLDKSPGSYPTLESYVQWADGYLTGTKEELAANIKLWEKSYPKYDRWTIEEVPSWILNLI